MKKVYCKKCRFYYLGFPKTPCEYPMKGYYCKEPHKIYVDSPITKIEESDNCFVKNKNNDCKYFKKEGD